MEATILLLSLANEVNVTNMGIACREGVPSRVVPVQNNT